MALEIIKSPDFEVTGSGTDKNWESANWIPIPQRSSFGPGLETKIKVLYSDTGIYFLFYCQDKKLTASMTEDFMDLWNEDVVEVFLWTDEGLPLYLEYELSPLNVELPILVPNNKGKFTGWRPWHYEGDRKTRHATSVQGGAKENGASIDSWMAEFFIPYALLKPLGQVPPQPGTKWRANMYRCDYDSGEMDMWTWQPIEKTFHEYEKFGTFLFK